ncbi:TolC family protein [Cyanobacterium aponinum FACHB-4101]|uniref:TolC family protein n=1 Tax=Cyanobacterium aponinum TaxID=379064 RepID=UPI0016807EDF|nr:TolC family protein [Cyanobacterium aponinum]MBD2395223.1 TolC family protein [Cyanobacterium aponinum FACHB-4101]
MKKFLMIYISKNKVFGGSGFNLLILTFVNITTLFVAQKSLLANELLLNMADKKKEEITPFIDDQYQTIDTQEFNFSEYEKLFLSQNPSEVENSIPPDLRVNPNPLELPTTPQEVETVTIPLSLEDAIAVAKGNSQQLKIAKINLEKSQAVLDEARAALFPTLSAAVTASRREEASQGLSTEASEQDTENQIAQLESSIPAIENQLDQIDSVLEQLNPADPTVIPTIVSLLIERNNVEQNLLSAQSSLESSREALRDIKNYAGTFIDGTVSLNYNIYSPGRQATINSASEQVLINQLEVQRIENELVLNVTLAYYDLQQADQEVKINQSDVTNRQIRLEGLQLQLEAQLATRVDLLNAQVELDNSIQNLRNSQTVQQTSRRNLARLLNLPPTVTPSASDAIAMSDLWEYSLEESIIMAYKNRVELQQKLAQRKSFEAQRQIALAQVRPTLALFANYQMLQSYTDDPRINTLVDGNFSTGYAFGLQLNWNFFDGGAANARARQADADIARTDQEYSQEADSIRFQVERAYLQLPSQIENINTAKQAVNKAQEAVEAAQIRFSAGVTTQTEVLDAQTRLVQAQNNLLNAVLGYNRAKAELQRAVKN